jgi:tetraprenyl-beta-curcumene synthase
MQDALTPGAPLQDYYRYREDQDDGGYLGSLVRTCQTFAAKLPAYDKIQSKVLEFSILYSDLQVYKHIDPRLREEELLAWWDKHKERYSYLKWQEFAAVTGSTIGIFALFSLAAEEGVSQEEIDIVCDAYFPWLCGLHILLDYLIDLEEDRLGGDLNFVSYYRSEQEATDRLQYFYEKAKASVRRLPNPSFHRMIVDGLITFYLADRKVNPGQPACYSIAKKLLRQAKGLPAALFYVNSLRVRR